jgi:hypothetical protein
MNKIPSFDDDSDIDDDDVVDDQEKEDDFMPMFLSNMLEMKLTHSLSPPQPLFSFDHEVDDKPEHSKTIDGNILISKDHYEGAETSGEPIFDPILVR